MAHDVRSSSSTDADERLAAGAPRALPDLATITGVLARHVPRVAAAPDQPPHHAAVAVVLCAAELGPELLLIRRARRAGDHWSGDIALPGGRRQPGDASIESTALRETLEETGVRLGAPVGRLDDYDARSGRRPWPLVVSPFVFTVSCRPLLQVNEEVDAALWIPLARLLDPRAALRHAYRGAAGEVFVPGVRVGGEDVLWGMTHRMLDSFLALLGLALPRPP